MENLRIRLLDDGSNVSVQTDRPGERATSVTVDARQLIQEVADAAGLTVTIEDAPTGE